MRFLELMISSLVRLSRTCNGWMLLRSNTATGLQHQIWTYKSLDAQSLDELVTPIKLKYEKEKTHTKLDEY